MSGCICHETIAGKKPVCPVHGDVRTIKGDVFLCRSHTTRLSVVLRALRNGDGPIIEEHRAHIVRWLEELKRYRERDHEERTKRAQAPTQHEATGHE